MATIIVVEDDLDINDIETIALKNIGYDVISCTCAGEFWEVMKQWSLPTIFTGWL